MFYKRNLPRQRRASLFILLCSACHLNAGESSVAGDDQAPAHRVRLVTEGRVIPGLRQAILVTHGCGGTADGDRFHRLASLLKQQSPDTNVYRLDWSAETTEKLLGFPNPWAIAPRVNPVGEAAIRLLREAGVDPQHLTLIGESFGVYVNNRIAEGFGKVTAMIGCNPANENGGYAPPDLRRHARRSCVFATVSVLDTLLSIADYDFLLTTPPEMSAFDQHIHGIDWLCNQIELGNMNWVELTHVGSPATARKLSGVIASDGAIDSLTLDRNSLRQAIKHGSPPLSAVTVSTAQ